MMEQFGSMRVPAHFSSLWYQHTFHIMVPVVFDGKVLWAKVLVPINALQRNAIKRFCSLVRKILFNQDQTAITPRSIFTESE